MLRLKLIHCSKWGPGCTQDGVVKQILFIHYSFSLGNLQNHCSSIVCQIIILTPITHRDTCHICIVIQGIKQILLWKINCHQHSTWRKKHGGCNSIFSPPLVPEKGALCLKQARYWKQFFENRLTLLTLKLEYWYSGITWSILWLLMCWSLA